jgi:hypothetical protein
LKITDLLLPKRKQCDHYRVVCLGCKKLMRHCGCLPDKEAGEEIVTICQECKKGVTREAG